MECTEKLLIWSAVMGMRAAMRWLFLKLCSRVILEQDFAEQEELLALADHVYRQGGIPMMWFLSI